MTDRERWIMYPLLFLSLGLTLRNAMLVQSPVLDTGQVFADIVRCKKLYVTASPDDPRPLVALGPDSAGLGGAVETFTADGHRQAVLSSNPSGALLTLFGPDERTTVVLGHEGTVIGLLAGDIRTGKYIRLSNLLHIGTDGPPQATEEPPATDGTPAEPTTEKSTAPPAGAEAEKNP